MKQPLSHVASRFIGTPLMIDPVKFEVIVRGVGPRIGIDPTLLPQLAADPALAQRYNDAGEDREYALLDGIAVIPVQGTLMKKDSWLSSWSGGCSYLSVQKQIQGALDDGSVSGILLDVDSPGGEVSGCFELTDFIFKSRGQKPIYATANDCALSAAYSIASAADRIFVTRTGAVGSVGVFTLHVDQSGFDEQIGAKFTYIFAGAKKVDGNPHEPLDKGAYKELKTEIDRLYEIFTSTVARNRKAEQAEVVATEAGLLWADHAIPLFADAVGTFDDAMAAIRKVTGLRSKMSNTAAAAAIPPTGEVEMKQTTEAAAAHPNAAAATEEETKGKAEAEPDPEDTNKEEEDREEEMKKSATGQPGKLLAVSTLTRSEADISAISALCKMAGCPEKTGDFLTKKNAKGEFISVAEVSDVLTNSRAEESEQRMIDTNVNPNKTGAAGLGALESEAAAFARQNKGVTKEQAFAQMLEANPDVYAGYRAEHNARDLARTLEAAGYRLTRA